MHRVRVVRFLRFVAMGLALAAGLIASACSPRAPSAANAGMSWKILLVQPAWRTAAENEAVRRDVEAIFAEAGHDVRRIDVVAHALDLHTPDQPKQMAELARRIEREQPAVVLTETMGAAKAVRGLGLELPLVFSGTDDPVRLCLVGSTLLPGGHVTGSTSHLPVEAKLVETLRDGYPSVRRVKVLVHASVVASVYDCGNNPALRLQAQQEEARGCWRGVTRDPLAVGLAVDARAYLEAAQGLGLALEFERVCDWQDVQQLLETWPQDEALAMVVPDQLLSHQRAPELVGALQARAIPAVFDGRRYADVGAVLSLARTREARGMQAATELALQVLTGTSPGHLPVRTPDGLEVLVSVHAAAQQPRLRPSLHMLKRADELLR